MNYETAKILIALALQNENGVFLKRYEDGRFGLPSRYLEENEQPEAIEQQLEQLFGVAENSVKSRKHSFKNLPATANSDENIVVILTTIILNGNNLTREKLIKINYNDLAKIHLDAVSKAVLGVEENPDQDSQTGQVNIEEQNNLSLTNQPELMASPTGNEHKNMRVFSDGGSRGNPGPSACGFVIEDENGTEIYRSGQYLGVTTNNQAEYHGVQMALEKALEMGGRNVDFRGDSMLVINQINGVYKIKNKELWPIYERIKELIAKFDNITFTHVYREYNQAADAMVNRILDEHVAQAFQE